MAQIREHQVSFQSLEEWQSWLAKNSEIADPAYVGALIDQVRRNGLDCDFCDRHLEPHEVAINGDNYRETLTCPCGPNARQRAVLAELSRETKGALPHTLRIYAPEAVTPFALKLRGKYVRFIGSEFSTDPRTRQELFPIAVEDLSALTYPDGRFDAVVVNDVFEHLPDLQTALREIGRTLRPGGVLISTVPFAYNSLQTVVRARLEGGEVVHLGTPEYHGDPVNPEGALVFQIPGWELMEQTRSAGFAHAEMRLWSSARQGLTGAEIAAIFVLVATR